MDDWERRRITRTVEALERSTDLAEWDSLHRMIQARVGQPIDAHIARRQRQLAEALWPEGGRPEGGGLPGDPFDAETRLLGYFGRLRCAAGSIQVRLQASHRVSDEEMAALREALVLPPDVEAALGGPRGRPP